MNYTSATVQQSFLNHPLNPTSPHDHVEMRVISAAQGSPVQQGGGDNDKEGDENKNEKEEQKPPDKNDFMKSRKDAKEIQAAIHSAKPWFNLCNGEASQDACEARHKGKHAAVLMRRGEEKERQGQGSRHYTKWNEPWTTWITEGGKDQMEKGEVEIVYEKGNDGNGKEEDKGSLIGIQITTATGKQDAVVNRATQWKRGLEKLLENHGDVLEGRDIYVQFGEGLGRGIKKWFQNFLPPLVEFAQRANERHGTNTYITKTKDENPSIWADENAWTVKAELWRETADALGVILPGGMSGEVGGHWQAERGYGGRSEDIMREMERTGCDMLSASSGIICPSRYDGIYPATSGEDSETDGRQFYLSNTCHVGIEQEANEGVQKSGRVGAPVKYARNQEEHKLYGEAAGMYPGTQTLRGGCEMFKESNEQWSKRQEKKEINENNTETGSKKLGDGEESEEDQKALEAYLILPTDVEPSYRDALRGPLKHIWLDAVLAEVRTQFNQRTFRVIHRKEVPTGCNIMMSGIRLLVKWSWSDRFGHAPTRFKARWVCGGDSQQYLTDYVYVSSPCPRPATVRWMMSKMADKGCKGFTMDISGAFCQAPSDNPGTSFMEFPRFLAPDDRGGRTPEGMRPDEWRKQYGDGGTYKAMKTFAKEMDPIAGAMATRSNAQRRKEKSSAFVVELLKMCYGQKQAARVWMLLWSAFMADVGFQRSIGDECLWTRKGKSGNDLIVCTHVDDSLCICHDKQDYDDFLEEVKGVFEATDEGVVNFFLGVRVELDEEKKRVKMSQEALADAFLVTADGAGVGNKMSTPMLESSYLQPGVEREEFDPTIPGGGGILGDQWESILPDKSREEEKAISRVPYRRLVGQLIHLVTWTRPDIAFIVSNLARFADPARTRWAHVKAMGRLVEYIRETKGMGITYDGLEEGEEANLFAFVDADWAGNDTDRLSTTGYVVMVRGGAISWQSARQKIVAQSSFESELIASRSVAAEMLGLTKDFETIEGMAPPLPFSIGCDNSAVVSVSTGGGRYIKRRHIDIRYFLIRESVMSGKLLLEAVKTDWNPSDLGTKALGEVKHVRFRDYMMNITGGVVEEGAEWLDTGIREWAKRDGDGISGEETKSCRIQCMRE